ncbi:MAG TPA: hypothetical protein VLA74_12245 [Nitrososphaeraceae archaeon]|nr:hypothetical protein [Nitrososphaeraceae archaeon]
MDKVRIQRIKKRNEQERDPEYLYQRVKEDLSKLERVYKDQKYRDVRTIFPRIYIINS